MHTRGLLIASIGLLICLPGQLSAQTVFNFTNTSGGAWSVGANWSSTGTPPPNSATDIARFNLGSAYTVDVNGTFNALALQFGSSQTNSVTFQGVTGTAPRGIVLNPGAGANGSIPAFDGQTTVFVQAGSHTIQNTVGVTLGGGAPGSPVNHVWEIQGSQNLTVAGQITATSSSANTLTKAGTGSLTFSANNSGSPLWNGGLTVVGGAVLVNNGNASIPPPNPGAANGSGTGTGPVTVNAGATLGGQGQILMGVSRQTTIDSGGTLTAGTSASAPRLNVYSSGGGGLTMNAGSTYAVRLFGVNASEISTIAVQGDAVINTNQIALDLGGLSAAQANQMRSDVGIGNARVYRVMTATESLSGTGFDTVGFTIANQGFFNTGEWAFGAFDTAGDATNPGGFVTLVFTPVPEPSCLLALGLGCVGLYRGLRGRPKKAVLTGVTDTMLKDGSC